jgi:hypothetical protein
MRCASFLRPVVVAVSLLAGACMYSPYDLHQVPTMTSAIEVYGCSVIAGSTIRVEADRHGIFAGTQIATFKASSSVTYVDSRNFSWYCWGGDVRVPREHWVGPPSGPFITNIRTIDTAWGTPTHTYGNDPALCQKNIGYDHLSGAPCAVAPTGPTQGYVRVRALQPF